MVYGVVWCVGVCVCVVCGGYLRGQSLLVSRVAFRIRVRLSREKHDQYTYKDIHVLVQCIL